MKLLFTANAGSDVGFGHLARLSAIASRLDPARSKAILSVPQHAVGSAQSRGFYAVIPQVGSSVTDVVGEVLDIANGFGVAAMVLDDYRFRFGEQLRLRNAGLKWLQFDPGANCPLLADIVVNTAPLTEKKLLSSRVARPGITLLNGPSYAPLRREFDDVVPLQSLGSQMRVLITFGGGDDRGGIMFVLEALSGSFGDRMLPVIVVGAKNPRRRELEDWILRKYQHPVELHSGLEHTAKVFASCHLAVIAAGTTTYEVARCGVPMILTSIAENQVGHATAWQKSGAATYVGPADVASKECLQGAFSGLLLSPELRATMSKKAAELVPSGGAERVATAVLRLAGSATFSET